MGVEHEKPLTLAGLRGASRRRPPTVSQPTQRNSSGQGGDAASVAQMGLLFATAPAASLLGKDKPAAAQGPQRTHPLDPGASSQPGSRAIAAPSPLSAIEPRPVPAHTSSFQQERRIWTVRSLVSDVRQHVELGYAEVLVEGELSNCRLAASGHVYATLKDGEAQLPMVLFRRQASLLRFRPADGLAVLVRGRLSVYDGRGQLQLIAETMEPRGAGALQIAFDQLKARLLAEGLFDAERKRPLPTFPRCIGIVTSMNGAVIRDIITVCRRRHGRLNLLVYPAATQGAECATMVAAGIRWFGENRHLVDLILIARGGGSLEDLAGFNDESLARAIAASPLPVVSAIGHETDFTIADFVADLRAPTPSAAAEIVTAAQHRIEERLASLERAVLRAGRYQLMHARSSLDRISAPAIFRRVQDAIGRRGQRVDDLGTRLEAVAARLLRRRRQALGDLEQRLRRQDATRRLALGRHRMESLRSRLERSALHLSPSRRHRLNQVHGRLQALSPLAVLARGYALVYASDGSLLRNAGETRIGETIQARLADGTLLARVTETRHS